MLILSLPLTLYDLRQPPDPLWASIRNGLSKDQCHVMASG